MTPLNGTITISNSEYRPCIVKDRKALFHRWEDKSEIHNAIFMGDTSGVIKCTVAIIEFENGVVTECYPYEIQFCDDLINEYCFDAYLKEYIIEIIDIDGAPASITTQQLSLEAAQKYASEIEKKHGYIITGVFEMIDDDN